MGQRKKKAADARKEENKSKFFAKLQNCPTSPRKMRLVADMVRGLPVEKALFLLRYNPKEASGRIEKLLRSAISNWEQKNEGMKVTDGNLYVKNIFVDSGFQLKRLRTAPQGRGYRFRKRSNHVTLELGSLQSNETVATA
jgi:large subunit ribosomal protein L22